MRLYDRWIESWERRLTLKDRNRRILPFSWGLEWIGERTGPENRPLDVFKNWAGKILHETEKFYAPPDIQQVRIEGDTLSFDSPLTSDVKENNRAICRIFRANSRKKAVIVVPQWNSDRSSHVTLCHILRRLGMTTVRLTLPFHENRKPQGMPRADLMVSPNLGRTIYATRQAVLEVRQIVGWLKAEGYQQVAVMGTSIGSCVTYLAFVHDDRILTGVFNHVSPFFADVVWWGLSTRYVRWGLEGYIALEDLRDCWAPISPWYFIPPLKKNWRPHLMITADYDLTFLPELSEKVLDRYDELDIAYQRVRLPCGHYTTGQFPFKYMDGWHICNYLRQQLA